jgi:predicted TPR repeat methyltransferase
MQPIIFSSGNLTADRRADYAKMLLASGDNDAAIELMRQALELASGWSAGWFRLGEMLEAAGRLAEAADCWRQVLALDPQDRFGAEPKLALVGAASDQGALPAAFVEKLFDQYADDFDAALVERLAYRAPLLIAEAIARTGADRFAHVLDLGCGTGLMGERLRMRASFLEGIDISRAMLAKAQAKGLYDRLIRGDLQAFKAEKPHADLVVAADVFTYLGALDRLIAEAARALLPGGLLAFTVEHHAGAEPFCLMPSRRYAHAAAYLDRLLCENGLERLSMDEAPIRFDRGEPVGGLVVIARRPALPADRTVEPKALPDLPLAEQLGETPFCP